MKGKGLIWFTSTRDSFTYNVVTDFQLKEMKCVVAFAPGGKERYVVHSEVRSFLNHTWIRSKPKKERMKLGLAYYQLSKQEGFFHVSYDISGTLVVQRWNLNSRCKNSLWYCKKNLDISLPIPITRQSLLLNSGFKVLFNKSVNFYTTLKPTYHGCQVFIWIWNKDFVAKQLTSSSFPSFECDQKKNY